MKNGFILKMFPFLEIEEYRVHGNPRRIKMIQYDIEGKKQKFSGKMR